MLFPGDIMPASPGEQKVEPIKNPAASHLYQPLRKGHFRLVTIYPSEDFNAKVRCGLSVHKPTDRPYKTLSYVWGDLKKLDQITVEGVEFNVVGNLNGALKHLRQSSAEIVIWIDAICIHQTDPNERSAQVARMSEVYENSEETKVWLGPKRDDNPRAIAFLKFWAKAFVSANGGGLDAVWTQWCTKAPSTYLTNLGREIEESSGENSMFSERNWMAVKKLAGWPWWWRLWGESRWAWCKRSR